MFITIEGIEAGGKSTLLTSLAARLSASGIDALVTREPGGTALGQQIRELFLARTPHVAIDPLAEVFLLNAARAQHVREVLRPALGAGRIVLCDRYVDSTIAYQGYGRGVSLETLRVLGNPSTDGLLPDLTLLVDVPIEISFARMRERESDRIEKEPRAFHERVRQGFLELAAAHVRIHTLDGTQSPELVLEEAWRLLSPLLERGSAAREARRG
ncbi:MAG TPA: dTMP kinase [Candidatus Baltobacteraceae bacterium]|nr:dTMP kinase [Candidatus Baltobacteraceae bacterium]